MTTNQKIVFKCFEVKQPIGTFYIGAMNADDLIYISYSDVRRLEKKERNVEIFSGIQRPLIESRVKDIGQYVNLVDATFPTSVLLSIKSENVDYNIGKNEIHINYQDNVAKVIDGQHRIAGLESYKKDGDNFQVNVSIFIDMEHEDEAIVFATINKAQTKVNKSLVADLFSFAKDRSPQKTAHIIVRALNEKENSPFYDKIKILGPADNQLKETITQATFNDNLIKYISKDPMTDRDLYKRGKIPNKVTGEELKRYFFRNLFIEEKDTDIAKNIFNYFKAVQNKWPETWNNVEPNKILNRSTGFISLMRFYKHVYLSFDRIGEVITADEYSMLIGRIKLTDDDFTRENFVPGSGGQSKLFMDLKNQSGL